VITSDGLRILGSISNHLNFIVESHNSNLSLLSARSHHLNLLVNGCLDTLESGHIGHILFCSIEELVRSVSELSHLLVNVGEIVALELMFSLNWLRYAHGS